MHDPKQPYSAREPPRTAERRHPRRPPRRCKPHSLPSRAPSRPVSVNMPRSNWTWSGKSWRPVQDEDMQLATRLAEQSRAEAELARARWQMTTARIVHQERRDSTASLK